MNTLKLQLPEQLQTDITFLKKELVELKNNYQPKDPSTYLTRKETAKLLKVDLSTLHNWKHKNILLPKSIGNRILYDRKDIEKAIVQIKS